MKLGGVHTVSVFGAMCGVQAVGERERERSRRVYKNTILKRCEFTAAWSIIASHQATADCPRQFLAFVSDDLKTFPACNIITVHNIDVYDTTLCVVATLGGLRSLFL